MKKLIYIASLLVAATGFAQQAPAPVQKTAVRIMNGTAHLGNGQVIENSVIEFEDGKLTIVGDATTMRLAAPKGEVIDASGKHIYPGMIAANTTLGLVEVDAVGASDDEREIGTYNPHIRSIIAYNAESKIVETMRPNGILLAQITPRGGRVSGKSSVVHMDAWNWEDAAVRMDDGIHVNWPRSFARSGSWPNFGPIEPAKDYDEQVEELRLFLNKAKAYAKTKNPDNVDLKLQAMGTAMAGTTNMYVHVSGEKAVIDVLAFAKANNLTNNLVLVGAEGSEKIAKDIAAAGVPVLAARVHSLPSRDDEDYDMPYKFPKLLADAGVLVGLENSGSMERHQVRNVPFYAGTVAGFGLDIEKALMMVTLNPAKILGIDKEYGSLEQGKSATLFISEGNALDMRTNKLTRAFIDGRDVSLDTRQKELYERYMEKYSRED
ncbi:amidohydrolase [Nonlabens sp. YIK11]|uniref:amidohydrolase family protein n=1 Tax=Nonlabens sp. YIK11 TaxID=1453349 RepID=UPI0006DBF02C|nr:amidohydrolase family protein [Nonlabens sp. YIK11]KQC33770.1 amidohydrolase [Nonlabens sp. YIK11]